MAIVSPSIRRSLHRFLAQSLPRNANAAEFVGRYGVVVTSSFSRIHSTRILSGDALDMADTFSRRHGKNKKWVVLCNITCEIIDSPATCYYRLSMLRLLFIASTTTHHPLDNISGTQRQRCQSHAPIHRLRLLRIPRIFYHPSQHSLLPPTQLATANDGIGGIIDDPNHGREKQGHEIVHWHGILRHHHPQCHSTQYARESRMVYRIYTLPGRNCPGTS
jgi:hypothetical protein